MDKISTHLEVDWAPYMDSVVRLRYFEYRLGVIDVPLYALSVHEALEEDLQ